MTQLYPRCLLLVGLIFIFSILFKYGPLAVESLLFSERLEIHQPQTLLINAGDEVTLDLYGQGFEPDMVVSLVKSLNEENALSTSYPIEGVFNDALIVNDILYLGSNHGGLVAIDVAVPLKPRLIGEYLEGLSISDIQERAGFIYLACGQSGVVIMKILDSGGLEEVVSIQDSSLVVGICFIHEMMAVAVGQGGVMVYTIGPELETTLVEVLDVGSKVTAIESSGNSLYLATQKKTIEVFAVTDEKIEHHNSVQLDAPPKGISLFQDDLFVVTADELVRYDLVTTNNPELSGQINSFGSADKIISGKNNVYVIDSFSRLSVVNPATMDIVKRLTFSSDIRTVTEKNDYLFVAGSNNGLQIIDPANTRQQNILKTMNTQGNSHDIIGIDDWLYVADKQGGVQINNLLEGGVFTQVSSFNAESFCLDRERKLLFVALGRSGIEVLDVSTPGQPQSVALWPEISAFRMVVSGTDLIVSKGVFGVDLIDSSDLNHPAIKRSYPLLHVMDLDVDASNLYTASIKDGLQIYAIERDGLILLSQITTPFPMNQFVYTVAVTVKDRIAYVANGRSGLMMVDVNNPEKAKILSLVDIPGFAKRVRAVNGKVFVSSQKGGVTVVNVEKLQHPRVESHIELPWVSRGLQVIDNFIYVTQRKAGVTAVPVPVPADRVEVETSRHTRVAFPEIKIAGNYDMQVSSDTDTVVFKDVVIVEK